MTHLANYDPSSFALDVYASEAKGLGRGRGFRFFGKRSILGSSPAIDRMGQRLLALVHLFLEHGVISEEEFASVFEVASIEEPDVSKVQGKDELGKIATLNERIVELEEEIDSLEADQEELDTSLEDLTDQILEALDLDSTEDLVTADTDEEGPLADLKRAVETLIDEFSASQATDTETQVDQDQAGSDVEGQGESGGLPPESPSGDS